MARRIRIVLTMAVLTALFCSVQVAGAMVDYDKMQASLDRGLAWLGTQQNLDQADPADYGSWGAPPGLCSNDHRVLTTAFAVQKMLDRARELGTTPPPAVQDGLNFIFRKVQADGSIWDYYPYEDCGTENAPPTVMETSAAIMAITSAGRTGEEKVSDPDSPVNGWSYLQVVQKAVDYLAWAQRTALDAQQSEYGDEGGWTYGKDRDPETRPFFVLQYADQLNTGYASLALLYAEKFGASVPTDVTNRLSVWTRNIQDPATGGSLRFVPDSEYSSPAVLFSGDLLIEQHLLGLKPGNQPVDDVVDYLEAYWQGGSGGYLTFFTVTTGLDSMGIGTLTVGGSSLDWFDDFAGKTVAAQEPVGSWSADDDSWSYGDPHLATEWALLALEGYVYPGSMTVTKTASATRVSAGQTVTYTFTVTNTGRSAIYLLSLEDDQMGIIGIPDSGDNHNDGILEPGEAWVYSASQDLFATTTNIAKASGVDLRGREVIATSDPVTVTVTQLTAPAISVLKSSSASLVHAGNDVTYTYQVENAGDTPLSGIHLTDDQLDLTNAHLTGDNNGDGILEQNEIWVYTITVPVNAKVTNLATVTGADSLGSQVSATSDPVTVDVIDPAIEVEKEASASLIAGGDSVTYTYLVSNNHDTPLSGITLADDKLDLPGILPVGDNNGNGILDPGETWKYTATVQLQETVTNIATVTGTDSLGGTVSAQSNAVTVTVNQPPDVTPATPSSACLWPPNHKFADIAIQGVTDPDGDPLSITITAITSDEPSASGTGSGGKTHAPDASGIGTDAATLLRAERSGNNNGRVYAISFIANDMRPGGAVKGTVKVCVPHDQRSDCICTDDGQKYDATAVN
jgi:hypothetical protein